MFKCLRLHLRAPERTSQGTTRDFTCPRSWWRRLWPLKVDSK
jgi:hypothetical protein